MAEKMSEKKTMEEKIMEETAEKVSGAEEAATGETPVKKRWFGRGIYGSKDVPIRLLDGLIVTVIVLIVVLTTIFAVNGGYMVNFQTEGGSEVEAQKLRYGEKVAEPEAPAKPGYEFAGWYPENEPEKEWSFSADKVGGELTLHAKWTPAKITVKFDLDGGNVDGQEEIQPLMVTYQEPYGTLPVPKKEGAVFAGFRYSGQMIEEETIVTMPGEHVLTAVWE